MTQEEIVAKRNREFLPVFKSGSSVLAEISLYVILSLLAAIT